MKTLSVYIMLLAVIALFCSSCATILSKKTTNVSVYTREPFMLTHADITYPSKPFRGTEKGEVVTFSPARSKDSLQFTIHNEVDTARYAYDSRINQIVFLNLYGGIGFIVDLYKKDKLYTYPQHINLTKIQNPFDQKEVNLSLQSISRVSLSRKGKLTLNLGFPTINFVNTYTNWDKKSHNGQIIFGISLGSDYYYHQNKFFNLTVGLTSDLNTVSESFYDYYEEYEDKSAQSFYTSLTHNHRLLEYIILGYGLSYSTNWCQYQHNRLVNIGGDATYSNNLYTNVLSEITEKSHALGLMFHAHFMPGESFYFGADYRPTFFRFQRHDKFRYEHLISISFGWKITLKRGK